MSFNLANKRNSYLLFVVMLIVPSCQVTTSRFNRGEDVKRVQSTLDSFYINLKDEDYKRTLQFFADTFLKKVDTALLFEFYRRYKSSAGTIKKVLVKRCETKVTSLNSKLKGYYYVVYTVNRSIRPTKEIFILESSNERPPKIYRYNILIQ